MKHAAPTWAALLALAPIACGQSSQWQGTIDERDGVVYVHSPAQGLWDDRPGALVHFELEQVFGVESKPADKIFNMIGRKAFDVDDRGNVYIFDGGDNRLVSFAPDGSLRWSAGRPGQGPGEFSGAQGMAWNGASTIYVTNEGGARIDLWSTDGEFLESRSISHLGVPRGSLVGVLDEFTVVVQASTRFPGVRVGVLDLRGGGSTVADFSVDISNAPTDRGAIMEVELVNGSIVVGDWDSYDLRFYSREGVLERVVSREFEDMVTPSPRSERSAVDLSSWLKPPLRLSEGLLLALVAWPDADAVARLQQVESPSWDSVLAAMRGTLDLFDADGRYLISVPSAATWPPEIGTPDAVGSDGRLYTVIRDPFPQVRRYRVEIDP